MKQTLSFSMMSVLVALTANSTVWAAAVQPRSTSEAIAKAKARATKRSAKPGDFVDATPGAKAKAQVAAQQVPVKTKKIGTVVRPMNGSMKGINTNPSTTKANTVATAIDDTPGIGPLKAGDFTFGIASKNTMTFGRKEELEMIGGKNYGLKSEFVLGAKHSSGFGLSLTAVYSETSNADTSLNKNSRGDASVIVAHPDLIKNDTFSLGGQARAFLPTSESSQSSGFRQYRYYSMQGLQLAHQFSLSQLIMPMWFSTNAPKPEDSPFTLYQNLELAHQTTKTIALAIGEQTTVETHYGTATGTTVEIYPFADITITKNILIEPKFYMPVYVSNIVDGPTSVTMNQTQAELFVKISI